jgi:hypothetical protein
MAFSQTIPASCATKVLSPPTTLCFLAVTARRCGIAGLQGSTPSGAAPIDGDHAIAWWLWVRKLIPKPLRRGFDSFFLMGWTLWKEHNARTFMVVSMPAP